jgi:hypothetical protein
VICPLLGSVKPASMRNSVVLPHPDAPTRANISPLKIRRLTASTAVTSPKRLLMPSITTCGLALGSSQGRSASCLASSAFIQTSAGGVVRRLSGL